MQPFRHVIGRYTAEALMVLGFLAFVCVAVATYLVAVYLPRQHHSMQELQLQLSVLQGQSDVAVGQSTNALAMAKKAAVPQVTLAAIIKEWSPRVPRVSCAFTSAEGTTEQSGSGVLAQATNGTAQIWTNKHVLTLGYDEYAQAAGSCQITFLDGSRYDVVGTSKVSLDPATDFGSVSLAGVAGTLPAPAKLNLCKTRATVGEPVVVLGYPAIGAESGITATEGIVAGIEGDYYVTSAKIDHGSSGGIAVSVKGNCYLGIPTFVKSSSLESMGRILMWQGHHTI